MKQLGFLSARQLTPGMSIEFYTQDAHRHKDDHIDSRTVFLPIKHISAVWLREGPEQILQLHARSNYSDRVLHRSFAAEDRILFQPIPNGHPTKV